MRRAVTSGFYEACPWETTRLADRRPVADSCHGSEPEVHPDRRTAEAEAAEELPVAFIEAHIAIDRERDPIR